MSTFRVERLNKHDRSNFDCGVDALNIYLKQRATQDMRRRFAACYVMIESATDQITGYYTLSAGRVLLNDLPSDTKKLPRYPSVPVARIGRLAISTASQGKGLGSALLFDAIKRSSQSELAAYAIVVDAKDDQAADFYSHFGFLSLESQPLVLYLPISDGLRQLE